MKKVVKASILVVAQGFIIVFALLLWATRNVTSVIPRNQYLKQRIINREQIIDSAPNIEYEMKRRAVVNGVKELSNFINTHLDGLKTGETHLLNTILINAKEQEMCGCLS